MIILTRIVGTFVTGTVLSVVDCLYCKKKDVSSIEEDACQNGCNDRNNTLFA